MPSTALQARIDAFEKNKPLDILETPLSPTIAAAVTPFTRPPPSPSPSPPNLGRRTSLLDLKDWVVEDDPHARNGGAANGKTPTQKAFANGSTEPLITFDSPPKPKPKPKPANLSVPPKLPPRKSSYSSLQSVSTSSSPNSNAANAPPPPGSAFLYPPRSNDSLAADHAHRYPPASLMLDVHSRNSSSHAPSSSVSSFHSVSLSSDTDPGTPGSVANFIATYPMDSAPPPLPSRTATWDSDAISLTESYEHVSASASVISPVTERLISADWEKAMSKRKPAPVPPKLPDRPTASGPSSARSSLKSPPPHPYTPHQNSGSRAPSSASHSAASSPILKPTHSGSSSSLNTPYVTTYQPRRVAPPPPSRSSDRSSVQSFATTYSYSSSSQHSHNTHTPSIAGTTAGSNGLKTKRPTPVPLAARKRYEAVFNANVIQRRKAEKAKQQENGKSLRPPSLTPNEARGRRAAGWRGLSVDLIGVVGAEAEGPGGGGPGTFSNSPSPRTSLKAEDIWVNTSVGPNDVLEAAIVKVIWKRSGLNKTQLAEIWNECDTTGAGALTIDGFAKGMWRIDEELRRAQAAPKHKSSNTSLTSAYRSRGSIRGAYPPSAARNLPRVQVPDLLR